MADTSEGAVFAFSLLGGFSSGITVSYVSMTYPILIPLGMGGNPWIAVLAFVAGSVGTMVTPLHLCAVMTADYFKTPLGKLMVKVLAAEAILLAVAAVLMIFRT